jgi:hypothetical protein
MLLKLVDSDALNACRSRRALDTKDDEGAAKEFGLVHHYFDKDIVESWIQMRQVNRCMQAVIHLLECREPVV